MTDNSTAPDALMRTATESAYRLDHPGDSDGVTVAGWLAANRVAARMGGFATVSPAVQDALAGMSDVGIRATEVWLTAAWGDITGTIAEAVA